MKLTVHLEGKNREELVAGLKAHLALIEGGTATATTTAGKRGKKGKAEEAEEEEGNFDLENENEEDEGEESEGEDTEGEDGEESEGEDEEEGEAATLEDVISACQAYVKKHGKEKGNARIAKMLAKYKAKNVQKLKPEHYPDMLAALGA